MSKPKELNFFVEELNWDLGLDWYRGRFDDRFAVRGESSPHYTNLPRFEGVRRAHPAALPDARLIYMVRDPIYAHPLALVHATGAGYETRPMEEALARADQPYVTRSRYWMQLQPYLERFEPRPDRDDHPGGAADRSRGDHAAGLRLRRRRRELHLRAVRARVGEVERPSSGDRYQFMERLIKLPGFRSFDRNFDRLPESHALDRREGRPRPEAPSAPKPELPRRPGAPRGRIPRGRRRPAGVRRPRVRGLERVTNPGRARSAA